MSWSFSIRTFHVDMLMRIRNSLVSQAFAIKANSVTLASCPDPS